MYGCMDAWMNDELKTYASERFAHGSNKSMGTPRRPRPKVAVSMGADIPLAIAHSRRLGRL